jgi:hypothetical protein
MSNLIEHKRRGGGGDFHILGEGGLEEKCVILNVIIMLCMIDLL